MDILKRFSSNQEAKNAGWIIGEQIFQMLISLIVNILSARYLGPANFGTLSYTASFVAFFTSIATLGMESITLKKMIQAPDQEGVYLGSAIFFRFCSAVLSSISICLIVFVLNPEDSLVVTLAALQSLQLVFQAFYILDIWFQRYLKSKYVSLAKMVACVVVALYRIFLLVTEKGIIWFALSNALSYLVISSILLIFYRRNSNQKLEMSIKNGMELLSDSYHFILSGLMVALYTQMDKIMIGEMLTDSDVGFYSISTSVAAMWIFIPTAIINSLRPGIIERKSRGCEVDYLRRLKQLYSIVIWLCLAASVVICAVAKLIVYIMYGEAFLGAVSSLRIVIWCETFSVLGTARGVWLVSENKMAYAKYYLGIGAIVNLTLNSILIPIMGINGAAWATLITQITTSMIAPLFFKETRIHTKYIVDAFMLHWN